MIKLNAREKNLALFVLTVGLFVLWGQVKKSLDKAGAGLNDQLADVEQQLNQSRELLAKATASSAPQEPLKRAPTTLPENRLTLMLLSDITRPKEASGVQVLRVDRSSESTVRLTVEGTFPDMMRFLGMLERMDGHFTVGSGEMTREAGQEMSDPSGPPHRSIRASLVLAFKG